MRKEFAYKWMPSDNQSEFLKDLAQLIASERINSVETFKTNSKNNLNTHSYQNWHKN